MNSPLRAHGASLPVTSALPLREAPARQPSMMRKFEVMSFGRDGDVRQASHIVPAHPLFEDAASAFVRGTILQTDSGPMAVEDLLPGDRVIDIEGHAARVLWIGATMIVPNASGQRDEMRHTWRITADKFGIGRPMPDLVLGQGARLLVDRPMIRAQAGAAGAMVGVADLADEMGLIRLTPPSPVRTYHVMLERHCAIRAAGLEVESYHPGDHATETVGRNLLSLFLSIFPHVETPEDFGPQGLPRVSRTMLEGLDAA